MNKKANPLWGSRFKGNSSDLLKRINNSISFDFKLAFYDLKVSKAYCKALFKAKLISSSDKEKIYKALNDIEKEIVNKSFKYSQEYEDIHMNIEMALIKKIGEIGGRIHTGRSRNDQVTTDLKLWMIDKTKFLNKLIKNLQTSLVKKAEKNIYTVMPGFTHLQNAQPISLGHYFMAFYEMFSRDLKRMEALLKIIDECPLGSGALAGTNFYNIDRNFLAKELGFSKPSNNSLDSVSDRDYGVEFLSNLSMVAMHCSRLAEDLIIWCSSEFSFAKISDSFSTGSSIMPQKKNPDAAELIRSKVSRIYGNLNSLLITLKGLPMGYSKDLQEDKEAIFDSYETVELILMVLTEMIKTIKINKKKMYESAEKGFSTATDFADWLVKNLNYPFRKSHNVTGKIVLMAEEQNCKLEELHLTDLKKIVPNITKEIFNNISVEDSVKNKKSFGGTGFEQVKKAIQKAKLKLRK
tara:strand:- start:48360 stop:49754 length:1395 start_codon:yes stop_codon:yes gene_type:complete